MLPEAFVLFLMAVLNLIFVSWDTGLRRSEMRTRVKWVQQFLNEWRGKCDWKPENYPHVHSPQSPSITLQPALRDGRLVNLPWALLVKGDVIILRPGQSAPGRCRSLQVRQNNTFVYLLSCGLLILLFSCDFRYLAQSEQLRNLF